MQEPRNKVRTTIQELDTTEGADRSPTVAQVAREAVKPCPHRPPEREIPYLRFFRDMTQAHIAEQLGISQMHVSRLISRSCRTIREQIEDQPQPRQIPAAA
ncbi:sigma factor-like helix-turn-helix DNA-binding protein [Streptomyces iranensis]|uniref:sigma factor-like helix-turn-helix DNA-binding protein n=1 Tax=Streptomyces iranensis TaxID=576784 RepID=UPI0039B75273